ncbi:SUMF1/EgtB/PvdO family nonheme iron enzyme [Nitrospira sp. MA-1]|nr:SUMF1/EgtB/PvdO family nonheme iron enzyme [Nitrospira sp. MA-1]
MDPVTISSLLAAAAGALGGEAVKDAYKVTKQAIKDLFGQDEDLLEALDDVEAKPQSRLKQETLQGQIEKHDFSQNRELLQHLAELERLLIQKELYVSTTYSATQSGSGGLAQGPGAIAAGAGGVAVGRDVHGSIYINPPAADPVQKAKHRYLERLINEFQILPLAAMGGGDELKGEVTLDQVYIELDTQTPLAEIISPAHSEQILRAQSPPGAAEREVYTALDIVTKTKKVLLLGGPGSGKSTFAKKLCAKMALAQLNNEKVLEGWESTTFPLFLTLRHVVQELGKVDLKSCPPEQQDHRLADVLFQAWCKQFGPDQKSATDSLEESLLSGNMLLVFDGVDEVPVEQRPRVYQAVMAILGRYPKIKHTIITCRSRSYTGPKMLPGFAPHHIAPFSEEKIGQFAQAWYTAQHELDEGRRKGLIQDLQANALGPLAELSPNPMLLTTMAILHRKGAGLPKERVKLYNLAVNNMLQRWEKDRDTEESRPISGVLKDERRLRKLMEHIAHFVHETEGWQESHKGMDRYILLQELEQSEVLGCLAGPFLNYVDQRAGLFMGEGGGKGGIPETYRFPHRTFQEYLAGCHMVNRHVNRAYRRRTSEGDYWYVAAQLGIEELWFNRRNEEGLLGLAYELCPEARPDSVAKWRGILWAGTIAVLLGVEPFEADGEHSRGGVKFLQILKKRLQQVMRESPLPAIERAEAGRHLAKLGDPRFREGAWWLPDEGLLGFIEIPAGSFQIGEKWKIINIDIPYTYYISRYPVTQAQFQAFVKDGGYQEEQFWPEAEAAGIWDAGKVKSQYDDEPRQQPEKFGDPFGLSNHPVVGVTWYEALAYCRWLTQKLREWHDTPEPLRTLLQAGGETGTPWSIMLPNEPEWEKAARGSHDDRTYPWGKHVDPNRANYRGTNIIGTNAVGCFPGGKSPYEVEELSGNVREWTRSVYEEESYTPDPIAWATREVLTAGVDKSRVLRGGSWDNDHYYVRCAYRLRLNSPCDWGNFIGFRVVASPFSSR